MASKKLSLFHNLFLRGLGIVSGFVLTILLITQYNLSTLGFFSILSIYALIFVTIGKFGLDAAYVRLKYEQSGKWQHISSDQKFNLVFQTVFLISIILTTILLVLCIFLRTHFKYIEYYTPELIYSSVLILPYALLLLNAEGLRAEGKSTLYTFYFGTSIPLFTLLFIAITLIIFQIEERYSILLSFSLAILFSYVLSGYSYKFPKTLKFPNVELLKSIGIFTAPFFLNSIAVLLLGWSDSLILSYYDKENIVGEYNFYLRLSNLVFAPVAVVGALFTKDILDYAEQKSTVFNKTIVSMTKLSFALSGVIVVIIVALKPLLFAQYISNDFTESSALYWLLGSQLFNSFTGPKDTMMQLIGGEKFLLKSFTFALVLNLAMNLYLVPKYSLLGASITNFASMVTWNILVIIYLLKYKNINVLKKWI
jgi:O-antigen/teichoic acid export membrane protein